MVAYIRPCRLTFSRHALKVFVQPENGPRPFVDEPAGRVSVGTRLLRVLEQDHDGFADTAVF